MAGRARPSGRSPLAGPLAFVALLAGCSLGLPDTAPSPDGGNRVLSGDGGIPGGPPPACPPDTTGFRPTQVWHPPNDIRVNRCSDVQSQQLTECLAVIDSQPTACDAFKSLATNTSCYQCAVTSSLAATYGPIIDDGGYVWPNFAGCVSALSGDKSATSCGAVYLASEECADFACRGCADSREYGPLTMACREYAKANSCFTAYNDSCVAQYEQQCYGQSLKEDLLKVIKLFCGPPNVN